MIEDKAKAKKFLEDILLELDFLENHLEEGKSSKFAKGVCSLALLNLAKDYAIMYALCILEWKESVV